MPLNWWNFKNAYQLWDCANGRVVQRCHLRWMWVDSLWIRSAAVSEREENCSMSVCQWGWCLSVGCKSWRTQSYPQAILQSEREYYDHAFVIHLIRFTFILTRPDACLLKFYWIHHMLHLSCICCAFLMTIQLGINYHFHIFKWIILETVSERAVATYL